MAPDVHTIETPTNGDLSNGNPITLGTGFHVTVASKPIYGIHFWVPATNSGTYNYALWQSDTDDDPNGSGTGTLLKSGSVSSGALVAAGWNTVLFGSPHTATSANVYRVGVHTSSGRYVSTPNAFASAGFSRNDVTLYQTGSDPAGIGSMRNGVFADDPGSAGIAYPNTVFNSTDYFVEPSVTQAGISVSLGRVTETDTARTLARTKSRAIGRVTETSVSRALTKTKAKTLLRATSTSVARPLTKSKSRALLQATSTNVARSIGRAKAFTFGRVTETDVSRQLSFVKARGILRVTEVDLASTLGSGRVVQLVRAVETDSARTMAVREGLGRATETDLALALSASGGQSPEPDIIVTAPSIIIVRPAVTIITSSTPPVIRHP